MTNGCNWGKTKGQTWLKDSSGSPCCYAFSKAQQAGLCMQGGDPACAVLALLKAEQQGYSGWPDPRSKRALTNN